MRCAMGSVTTRAANPLSKVSLLFHGARYVYSDTIPMMRLRWVLDILWGIVLRHFVATSSAPDEGSHGVKRQSFRVLPEHDEDESSGWAYSGCRLVE